MEKAILVYKHHKILKKRGKEDLVNGSLNFREFSLLVTYSHGLLLNLSFIISVALDKLLHNEPMGKKD